MAIILPSTRRRSNREKIFDQSQLLQAVQTGDVLSSGAMEGWGGAGSSLANVESFLIERDTGREQNLLGYGIGAAIYHTGNFIENVLGGGETEFDRKPLTKEDWLESNFYRPDLEYKDGLTNQSARIMASTYDREQNKNFILSKASGWQTAGFSTSSILTSLADPKGIAAGVGAGAVVRGGVAAYTGARTVLGSGAVGTATKAVIAGKVAQAGAISSSAITKGNQAAIKSLSGFKYTKKVVAAEAFVGTAAMAATGFQAEKVLGREYGVDDLAVDFAASIGLSVGLHIVGKYIGKAWLKTSSPRDIDLVSGIVEQQINKGDKVDVMPAVEAQMAERYIPLSTLEPSARKPKVTQVGRKKQYEAVYQNEHGIYSVVKGKGKTPEEAIADLENIYRSGEVTAGEYNSFYTPEYYQEALRVQDANDRVSAFDIDAEENAEFARIYGEEYDTALDRIIDLEQEIENLKQTRGKSKVAKAEKRLNAEQKKFDDALTQALSSVNDRFTAIKRERDLMRENLKQMQMDLAAPNFVGWVKKQLSDNPVERAAGVDDVNTQKYTDQANEVKNGDEYVSSSQSQNEIESLREMALDENMPQEFKKIIKDQVKDVETSKKVKQAYQSFLLCKAK